MLKYNLWISNKKKIKDIIIYLEIVVNWYFFLFNKKTNFFSL